MAVAPAVVMTLAVMVLVLVLLVVWSVLEWRNHGSSGELRRTRHVRTASSGALWQQVHRRRAATDATDESRTGERRQRQRQTVWADRERECIRLPVARVALLLLLWMVLRSVCMLRMRMVLLRSMPVLLW